MTEMYFDDVIEVYEVDKEGKKYDKVSRIEARGEGGDVYLQLDVSSELYPMRVRENYRMVLAPTLTLDGAPTTAYTPEVLAFLNSIILLNQSNQVVVIATGLNSCAYLFDSSASENQRAESLLAKLEQFAKDDELLSRDNELVNGVGPSLLSGSLSMALCYIQRLFRSGDLHPQPRILCLHGSPDGPGQYVSIMNAIFSAQRSSVPIDSCIIGSQHSAFLQQASYITGGVYLKPQHLDGLFQYLAIVFATDLHSRNFLQLPKPVGVDFRASCFCHKSTIDMGFICSVCLSIFCKHHKSCSTCGSVFGQSQTQDQSLPDRKRKNPAHT